jgi:hypothetical protein
VPSGDVDLLVRVLSSLGYDAGSGRPEVEVELRVEDGESEGQQDQRGELIREETRTVLDHQISNLEEINDVAARTVRVTAIIVGGLLGAASLGGGSAGLTGNAYVLWGGAHLLASMVFGLHTSNVSEPYYGPGKRVVNEWTAYDSKSNLISEINRQYAEWIDDMEVLEVINGLSLDVTQLTMGIGLVYSSFGVLLAVTSPDEYGLFRTLLVEYRASLWHAAPLALVFALALGLILYSWWRF